MLTNMVLLLFPDQPVGCVRATWLGPSTRTGKGGASFAG
jgi:hypothetical protein